MNKPGMRNVPRVPRGFSLLELMGALAVASALLIGLVVMMDNSLDDMKGQQASAYQVQVTAAVKRYISTNYGDLISTTSLKRLPDDGTPKAVDIKTLTDEGFLPAGFSDRNIYNQQGCVLLRRSAPEQVDALVITNGGTTIDDKDIAVVAANAGQGSGYISTRAPGAGTVVGASWSMATTNFRNVACLGGVALTGTDNDAGHLVSRVFQNGDTRADFLYRDDVGVPSLNTMTTPILLANNAANRSEDAMCSGPAIATDDRGELLQCVNNKWAYISKWKAPVDNYAALQALPNNRSGDVRMAMDIRKAFVFNGTKWDALAEDENGDLNVTRNVSVGVGASGGKLTVAGDAEIRGSLYAIGQIRTDSDINAKGNGYVNGYVMVGDQAAIAAVVNNRTAGTGAKAGDVWASNDLQAAQEARSSWMIADSSITAESLFMNYQKAHQNGGGCNAPAIDRYEKPYTIWPVGTIAAEGGGGLDKVSGYPIGGGSGKLLYCGTDNVWHYVE